REYLVATVAARGLDERFRADPSVLVAERLEIADYRDFRDYLEATYLIRLFAEFEAGLREAWEFPFGRTTVPRVRDLIDSLHAQCSIPRDGRACGHEVRIYRNALFKEGSGDVPPIGLREACSWLCRFFSRLPHGW